MKRKSPCTATHLCPTAQRAKWLRRIAKEQEVLEDVAKDIQLLLDSDLPISEMGEAMTLHCLVQDFHRKNVAKYGRRLLRLLNNYAYLRSPNEATQRLIRECCSSTSTSSSLPPPAWLRCTLDGSADQEDLACLSQPHSCPNLAFLMASAHLDSPLKHLRCLIVAAAGHHPTAMFLLGNQYLLGVEPLQQDLSEALNWFKLAASLQHAEAQHWLANLCYDAGEVKEPFRLWRRAARQGIPAAWRELGYCHLRGDGTPVDEERAVRCWRRAIQKGDGSTCYALAVHLLSQVDRADDAAAVELLRLGAGAGEEMPASNYRLALCLDRGRGCSKDPQLALQHFVVAANLGDPRAKRELGIRLLPTALGLEWLAAAAEEKDGSAVLLLGKCYADGRGVGEDTSRACELFAEAQALGVEGAERELEKLFWECGGDGRGKGEEKE